MSENLQNTDQIPCNACGAYVNFTPGTTHLTCPYCSEKVEIPNLSIPEQSRVVVQERDLWSGLSELENQKNTITIQTVECSSCKAQTTLPENVSSGHCPFCATPILQQSTPHSILAPESLLPFVIDRKKAEMLFKEWIQGLWFAPNALVNVVKQSQTRLNGIYLPFYTFDAQTSSEYTGERGTYYYTTETYTTTENGKSVTRTRQVRHTRWESVSGVVNHFFDDVLVCGTYSVPVQLIRSLEPWDLQKLEPFQNAYLAGFQTQSAQVNLKEGFGVAQSQMSEECKVLAKHQIGGDEQRIHQIATEYSEPTFKSILLPIWMSAYQFNSSTYRFVINARTGEVQGERPYSVIKIALLVLLILAMIVSFFYLKQH